MLLGWASTALETLVCAHLRELLLRKGSWITALWKAAGAVLAAWGGYWSWGWISVRAFSLPSALNLLVLRCKVSWMSQRRMGCAFENESVDRAFRLWCLCTCRKISLVSSSTLVFTSSTSLGLTFWSESGFGVGARGLADCANPSELQLTFLRAFSPQLEPPGPCSPGAALFRWVSVPHFPSVLF